VILGVASIQSRPPPSSPNCTPAAGVVGRDDSDPELMKPSPYLVQAAVGILDAHPAGIVQVFNERNPAGGVGSGQRCS
jgi:hypothetical protein